MISSHQKAVNMEPYIAEIRLFAGNFPPRSWSFCAGQILSISEYTALFSLIGTTYGGDGQSTFALPNLQGRIPVGTGQGPGLQSVVLGEMAGAQAITLNTQQIPSHNHPASTGGASTGSATSASPSGGVLATADQNVYTGTNATVKMGPGAVQVGIAGGSLPHNNIMPVLALNYIICKEGIYPSRN